jgi:serine/threonine-protein kinase
MRALRKDPSERFATAREMAVAIERAIGLVTPAEIGAWASELGAESLAARANAVAEIESSPGIATAYATPLLEETATMPVVIPPDPMDDIDNMVTVPRAPLREPMDEIDNMVTVPRAPNRPAAKVIVAAEPLPPPPPRRRWLWLALAMLAVFFASFVAVFALSRKPVEEEVAPPRPRAAAPKSTPSAEPSVTAPPEELAPVEIPSASVKKPQPTIFKPPPPPPPPTTTVAKPNCSPPYYYENGIKHFKPNCL